MLNELIYLYDDVFCLHDLKFNLFTRDISLIAMMYLSVTYYQHVPDQPNQPL